MPDWRAQARERVKTLSEGNRLALTVGDNCLRILPDKKDVMPDGRLGPKGITHKPVREFRIHYGVGPDKTTCGCGYDIDGQGACWGCDVAIPALEKKPEKRKYASEIAAKDCLVMNASMFNVDTQKFAPAKPWWPSVGGGGSLAVRIYSKLSTSKKDYVDPIKGYNLTIKKTGEGMNTRYPEIEGDESPTPVPKSILIGMKDLDTIVPKYDEEEWKDAFYGRTPKEMVEDIEGDGANAGADDPDAGDTGEAPGEYGNDAPADEPDDALDDSHESQEIEDAPVDPDAPEEYYPDGDGSAEDPDAPELPPEDEYVPEPEPAPAPKRRAPAPVSPPAPARRPAATPARAAAPAPKGKPAPARRK